MNDYEVRIIEILQNDYFGAVDNTLHPSTEYRKNGTTTVTFNAIYCSAVTNSWIHFTTLNSKPETVLYMNLVDWKSDSVKVNCKIESDGKVYMRSYDLTDQYYYGTITFS